MFLKNLMHLSYPDFLGNNYYSYNYRCSLLGNTFLGINTDMMCRYSANKC